MTDLDRPLRVVHAVHDEVVRVSEGEANRCRHGWRATSRRVRGCPRPSEAPEGRLRHFQLGEALQWDRSRLSHQLTRMAKRGLVTKEACPTDARGSYVVPTAAGRAAIESAAPARVAAVRRYLIDALDTDQLAALADVAETVLAHLETRSEGSHSPPCPGYTEEGRVEAGGTAMTVQVRRDSDIYQADGGWFQARWHFSFDRYRDPEQMGVGPLRVFNDDRLRPGAVWPLHPHRDIESCTYVAEGHFGHDDSLGNDGELHAGAAQVMRFSHAGALHSELNASGTEPMRFMQFWLLPSVEGLESSVQQRPYTREDRTDTLLQIMGPEGEDGLDVAQDARVWVSSLATGRSVRRDFADGRGGYLYVMDGAVEVGRDKLSAGDAAKIFGPEQLTLAAIDPAEIILIDVPLEFRPVGIWAQP